MYDLGDYLFACLFMGIIVLLIIFVYTTNNVDKVLEEKIQIKGSYLKYDNNYYKKISEDDLDNIYFLMGDE